MIITRVIFTEQSGASATTSAKRHGGGRTPPPPPLCRGRMRNGLCRRGLSTWYYAIRSNISELDTDGLVDPAGAPPQGGTGGGRVPPIFESAGDNPPRFQGNSGSNPLEFSVCSSMTTYQSEENL